MFSQSLGADIGQRYDECFKFYPLGAGVFHRFQKLDKERGISIDGCAHTDQFILDQIIHLKLEKIMPYLERQKHNQSFLTFQKQSLKTHLSFGEVEGKYIMGYKPYCDLKMFHMLQARVFNSASQCLGSYLQGKLFPQNANFYWDFTGVVEPDHLRNPQDESKFRTQAIGTLMIQNREPEKNNI